MGRHYKWCVYALLFYFLVCCTAVADSGFRGIFTHNGAFLVAFDGGRYEYAAGKLRIFQGDDEIDQRLVATVTFEDALSFEEVSRKDDYVKFASENARISIGPGFKCNIKADSELTVEFESGFTAKYHEINDYSLLLAGIKAKIELQADLSDVIAGSGFSFQPDKRQKMPLSLADDASFTIKVHDRPMILWYHTIYRDSLESLDTALSSGLVTHVMLKRLHRYDCDIERYSRYEHKLPKSIEKCRKYNVDVILARNFWPSWRIDNSSTDDLYDADYYIQEIERLRAEAKHFGVRYTALDTEAYGDSPLKQITRKRNYDDRDLENLEQVIQDVLDEIGQIDFITPAGSNLVDHPYNIMAKLARYRICQHTYYDNISWIENVRYPYEIFGAYINTDKKNPNRDDLPYFLIDEIFDQAHLWLGKDGLFLYFHSRNKEGHALELAEQLSDYSKKLDYNE